MEVKKPFFIPTKNKPRLNITLKKMDKHKIVLTYCDCHFKLQQELEI